MKKALGCLIWFILSLIFLFLVGLIALTLSGAVEVPLFSKVLYRKPPSLPREVSISHLNLEEKLALAAINQSPLVLSESELSFLLEESGAEHVKSLKANVFENRLMLLAVLDTKRPLYLTFELVPKNDQGDLEVKKVKIGYLPIPVALVKGFLPHQGTISLKEVLAEQNIKLRHLRLRNKEIVLDLDWAKMLEESGIDLKELENLKKLEGLNSK